MNAPERIAQAYLRLNGFFTIPHFSVLSKSCSHIDFLAVRLGNSEEKIGVGENLILLDIDDDFLNLLGVSKNDTVGLVVEVKGGKNERAEISNENFQYARPFFGRVEKIFRVGFERDLTELWESEIDLEAMEAAAKHPKAQLRLTLNSTYDPSGPKRTALFFSRMMKAVEDMRKNPNKAVNTGWEIYKKYS